MTNEFELCALLPHTHKETKLDTRKKTAGYNFFLNSLAELHSCNAIFFLEAKKRGQDLYIWMSRPPNGPTIKFHVNNLHTMGELNTGFAGNCLKGGRGIVVFDKSFDNSATLEGKPGNEWRALVREMMKNVFCVPKRGVKGMKPFIDRVTGIYFLDGKIWIRVFEIRETEGGSAANVPGHQAETIKLPTEDEEKDKKKSKKSKHQSGLPDISLVEIGPRFVLTPIVMLEGSFGGPVIYENREFVSPNQVRSEIRMKKAARYASRVTGTTDRTVKKTGLGLTTAGQEHAAKDPLQPKKVFA
ncbi:Ribosome biogenesis protein brx1 [Ascosphaera pollenicola]|nr:Ribosome biogenesis protein brx1 [Ascosphaera pollenicola]